MTTPLIDFQRTFAEAVMRPLTRQDNLRRGSDAAIALVKPNERLTSAERLEIYARSYWSRLLDAFGEDFPGLRAVLGAGAFERIRRRYLAECPSESFTLRDLGRRLPARLREQRVDELAVSMAELEWAEIESFDAAAFAPLTARQISELTPQSTLRLQPHLQLVEAACAVDELLLEVCERVKAGLAVRRFSGARLEALRGCGPLYVAVHRPELTVHYKRLDREMFLLLRSLGEGAALDEAVARAYNSSVLDETQQQQHIQQSFALFAALGWLAAPADTQHEETQEKA